mmetsp:Transcript_68597/g.143236  ORF Transcript_68597/g.143236 Transcript_68597/m.143236 type:complete len:106 (+) Transcript_68597:124-441(+)
MRHRPSRQGLSGSGHETSSLKKKHSKVGSICKCHKNAKNSAKEHYRAELMSVSLSLWHFGGALLCCCTRKKQVTGFRLVSRIVVLGPFEENRDISTNESSSFGCP